MTKDRRYITVKNLISSNHIKLLREIFDVVPKSVVAADLKISNVRFSKLIHNTEDFYVRDLYRIANLIEVDVKILLDLAHAQWLKDNKGKRSH